MDVGVAPGIGGRSPPAAPFDFGPRRKLVARPVPERQPAHGRRERAGHPRPGPFGRRGGVVDLEGDFIVGPPRADDAGEHIGIDRRRPFHGRAGDGREDGHIEMPGFDGGPGKGRREASSTG